MMFLPLLTALLGMALGAPALRVVPVAGERRVEVVAALPPALWDRVPIGKLTREQGEAWLRLAVWDGEAGRMGEPIFGVYEAGQSHLVFRPRYPLAHGQRYRVTFGPARLPLATLDYRAPDRKPTPPAVVDKVYPTTSTLPANQLKFYIHFSRPMRESRTVFDHIQLIDGEGQPIPDPWRRTELWTADARRLTLWIHPGRIKKGVKLGEELGPVLRPGRSYRLVIGAGLRDVDGQFLGKAFTKAFRTSAADRTRPQVESWKVRPPAAGAAGPVVLVFPKPLDRALLDRLVTVQDPEGRPLRGRIEVGEEEKSWSFHPARPWLAALYTVRVDGDLEDLAGNTPLRPFDRNLKAPAPSPPQLTISFRPQGDKSVR